MRAAAVLAAFCISAPASAETTVTDVAGRTVTVATPVERFVISEGRYAELLALLRPEDPMRGVVGMMTPIGDALPGLERQLTARDPGIAEIPSFGLKSGETVSVERILSLDPDLAIFGLQDHGPGAQQGELIAQLEAAGVPVAFIDFRLDPLANTAASIALVGRLLGAEDRARAFNAYQTALWERIASRIATAPEPEAEAGSRPRVFFMAHVGRFPCCTGFADGMLGPFVAEAGGENIADAAAPGPVGRHNAEFLLAANPDVLIGTASGSAADLAAGAPYMALGDGVDAAAAQRSIAEGFGAETFQALDAVQRGRAHGLWHGFYNSPFNIVALEALAGWIRPDLFPDSDPQARLAEIYKNFLGLEVSGERFVTLGR